jgi:hypothetical protein
MVKYQYKVIKAFSIFKDDEGKRRIAETDEQVKSGTRFNKSAQYVDYTFGKKNLDMAPITQKLCDEKYLKLVSKEES